MSSNTIIETRELTKKYGHQTAVDRLTFSVDEGEIFGFLGPNGAGKTTTLLMLLGLTEPSAGSATVLGVDPTREPIKVKTKIGYLQENMGFYSDLNAIQMLQFVGELNGVTGEIAEARIDGALQAVGLFDEAAKKIGAYSRGMRQRLGIAELLIKDSKVAFLDEPTLGLDPDATNRMIELIRSLSRDKQMTILLSSHMLHQVQKICHRIGIMIKGRMVAQGPIDVLAQEKFGVGSRGNLHEVFPGGIDVQSLKTIIKKELADHISSYRFIIIFALIAMVSLITTYMVGLNIRQELENVAKPQFVFLMLFTSTGALFSLVQFVAFFGPLVGLVLGFDTINSERNEGTLSKLLSQPIYRDVVFSRSRHDHRHDGFHHSGHHGTGPADIGYCPGH
jgi:ABC-2 type transport system ATP-binding protein